MGYMDAKFATHALLSIKGAITAESYNAAVRALKNQSRRTCSASRGTSATSPYHIPNNADITVDYKGGKVVAEGEVLRDRRRSTRRSPRPAPGRRSSS